MTSPPIDVRVQIDPRCPAPLKTACSDFSNRLHAASLHTRGGAAQPFQPLPLNFAPSELHHLTCLLDASKTTTTPQRQQVVFPLMTLDDEATGQVLCCAWLLDCRGVRDADPVDVLWSIPAPRAAVGRDGGDCSSSVQRPVIVALVDDPSSDDAVRLAHHCGLQLGAHCLVSPSTAAAAEMCITFCRSVVSTLKVQPTDEPSHGRQPAADVAIGAAQQAAALAAGMQWLQGSADVDYASWPIDARVTEAILRAGLAMLLHEATEEDATREPLAIKHGTDGRDAAPLELRALLQFGERVQTFEAFVDAVRPQLAGLDGSGVASVNMHSVLRTNFLRYAQLMHGVAAAPTSRR